MVLLDSATDWERLRELVPTEIKRILVAADRIEDLADAEKFGLIPLVLDKEDSPLLERLQHALLEAVADELLANHCDVIAVYCGFEVNRIDSISIIRLDERMRRFTSRDLQRLESSVPLNNLKIVIDLAVQIGREGREGKKVGTMFVVGDTRKVLQHCKDSGFDPLKGYSRKNRNLHDARVREDIKEIAQNGRGVCRIAGCRRRAFSPNHRNASRESAAVQRSRLATLGCSSHHTADKSHCHRS